MVILARALVYAIAALAIGFLIAAAVRLAVMP